MSAKPHKNKYLEDLIQYDAETKTTSIAVPFKSNKANGNLRFVVPGDEAG